MITSATMDGKISTDAQGAAAASCMLLSGLILLLRCP